jgi:hypothetical protein
MNDIWLKYLPEDCPNLEALQIRFKGDVRMSGTDDVMVRALLFACVAASVINHSKNAVNRISARKFPPSISYLSIVAENHKVLQIDPSEHTELSHLFLGNLSSYENIEYATFYVTRPDRDMCMWCPQLTSCLVLAVSPSQKRVVDRFIGLEERMYV